MTDSDELELRWPFVAARFVWWGILAAALYLLSIGPAYWLLPGRSTAATQWTLRFYAPVHRLSEVAQLSEVLSPYCTWWAELPGGTVERILRDPQPRRFSTE